MIHDFARRISAPSGYLGSCRVYMPKASPRSHTCLGKRLSQSRTRHRNDGNRKIMYRAQDKRRATMKEIPQKFQLSFLHNDCYSTCSMIPPNLLRINQAPTLNTKDKALHHPGHHSGRGHPAGCSKPVQSSNSNHSALQTSHTLIPRPKPRTSKPCSNLLFSSSLNT